jgi:WD40 repeat protein
VICLAFAPDGSTLAAGDSDANLTLWDGVTGEKRFSRQSPGDQIQCLDFSPDGTTLATGSLDGIVRLLDVASGAIGHTLNRQGHPVCAVRFARNGLSLAAGYGDGLVWLWDLAGGGSRARFSLPAHSLMVQCLAFSPDGSTLASGGVDCIRLWDATTGRELAVPAIETGFIKAAVFAPDGRTLIVARHGGMIQRWDVAAGHEMGRRQIHPDNNRVAFSSDARFVASGGSDAVVRVWEGFE